MELVQQVLALLAVFGLLAAALWFVRTRRSPILGRSAERRLRVLERVALSQQHSLCLVQIDRRIMMVTTGPGGCQVVDMQSTEVAQ